MDTVAYRMVPLFTATSGYDAVRDRFGPYFMLAFSRARMLLIFIDIHSWYWLTDFGLFLVSSHQCWQWHILWWKPSATPADPCLWMSGGSHTFPSPVRYGLGVDFLPLDLAPHPFLFQSRVQHLKIGGI
jgi:hypothetical protein